MKTRATAGVPLWLATFLAAVGGVVDAFAFPGYGIWPLIFVGTPLVLFALVGRSVWGSLLVGVIAGFAFWGTHILWLTVYLGPVPWLALAGLETVFYALGCALIALAWRFGDRMLTRGFGRFVVLPTLVGGLWTLREQISTTWPYGGFSWGRLSFSQSESPLRELVSWVGVAGLSFLIAMVSALMVQVFRDRRRALPLSAATLSVLIVLALVPGFAVETSGTARIAAVQGNSDAGLFAANQPGDILADHLSATEPIFGENVDLIVWPENSSDLNPLEFREAASVLDRVTRELDAPMIVGTRTTDGDDLYNSLLLWERGQGSVDQYDKLNPVPFAEYIPDREFWFPLAPDLLSLVPRDFSIGTRDNVLSIGEEVNGTTTAIEAGVAICFDIVSDALIRKMIDDGADVIIAPTNNADFGRTDESVQQLAIARLRAIETGRSVVNTSTVGTSAIIAPDGTDLDRLPTFTPGTMVEDVPLSVTRTAASNIGAPLEIAISIVSLAGLIALMVLARTRAVLTSRPRTPRAPSVTGGDRG